MGKDHHQLLFKSCYYLIEQCEQRGLLILRGH